MTNEPSKPSDIADAIGLKVARAIQILREMIAAWTAQAEGQARNREYRLSEQISEQVRSRSANRAVFRSFRSEDQQEAGGRAFAAARFLSCIPNPCNFHVNLSVRIQLNNCIASCKQGGTVKYADLIDGNVTKSELKTYLVGGENVAVTVRIPKNMRDIAKQAAELSGVSFTSLVKMSLIEHLVEKDN